MDFTPYSFLMDLGLMSILIIVGQLMRAKFKFIQNMFLPASLIAGIMGLFLGKHFLNILPFSSKLSSYPYMFIIVIFGALFVGKVKIPSFKKIINDAGDTFAFNSGIEFTEIGIALTIGSFILLNFFPEVNIAFPLAMPGGFFGGHGYGTSLMGSVQLVNGWDEAITMAQTFATIGILLSVIVGVLYVNIGVRKGYTRFTKKMNELPEEMITGMLPPKSRESIGTTTTHTMSVDSMTWHLALIMIPFLGGYLGTKFFLKIIPQISLPETSLAMVSGLILMFLLKRIKINGIRVSEYVDRKTVSKLSGTFGDYLVAFGIAAINPNLVIKYAMPIIIMSVIGITWLTIYLFVFCRRLYHNFWFERGIFVFGWGSGTVAMGMTLLKIIDPEYKSGTVEDYGLAYIIIGIIEVLIVTFVPSMLVNGMGYLVGVAFLAIFTGLMIFTWKKYGLQSSDGAQLRAGEAAIINGTNADTEVMEVAAEEMAS